MVIALFSTVGERRAFRQSSTDFIDDRLTILILTNHSDMIVDELAIDLAGICLPALKRPEAKPDPNPRTTAKSKAIVAGLLKGDYEPAAFTAPMLMFLNTATGKAFWKWFADHGVLGSFVFSDREERRDGEIRRYKLSLGRNWYWLSVTTSKDGKHAQIYWW